MRKLRLFGGYFEQFIKSLTQDEQKKMNYILDMLKWNDRISSKFVKHLRDGLFELRMEYTGNIYRCFLFLTKETLLYF